MNIIRSNILEDHTAATEKKKIDLPTHPLSHLIITLAGYNVTDEATLAEILAFINSISITQYGRTIFNLESEDVYGLQMYLFGNAPMLMGKLATDNYFRALSLIVPFGRRLYDPDECFPATKKGELTLNLDYTIPSSSLDNGVVNIDAVQLEGANPSRYLRATNLVVSAPGATGENKVDLPTGNDIFALQLRQTTFPVTSSHTFGVDKFTLLANDSEKHYMGNKMVSIVGEMATRINTQITQVAAAGLNLPDNIAWIDFDPAKNDKFLLKTEGLSSLKANLDMGVDEAVTMSIFELVNVGS